MYCKSNGMSDMLKNMFMNKLAQNKEINDNENRIKQ